MSPFVNNIFVTPDNPHTLSLIICCYHKDISMAETGSTEKPFKCHKDREDKYPFVIG